MSGTLRGSSHPPPINLGSYPLINDEDGKNGELVSHGDDASRSTGPGYVVEVKRIYNCFDAWVALEVDLYALEDDK